MMWLLSGLCLALLLLFGFYLLTCRDKSVESVAILVLGDVGRSPRMQRHALSSLKHLPPNCHVHIVGFLHSSVMDSLNPSQNGRIHLHPIYSKRLENARFFVIYAFVKVLSELVSLLWILLLNPTIIPNLSAVIMQNPPSIPIVIIARLATWLRRSQFIIDWHNFGFTILALKMRPNHIFIRVYRWIERYIGGLADRHLCVTKAMSHFLQSQWRFSSDDCSVLYDRPTDLFLNQLSKSQSQLLDTQLWDSYLQPLFAQYNSITNAKQNDSWMITSTSWTPDEDLNMLLDERVLTTIDECLKKLNCQCQTSMNSDGKSMNDSGSERRLVLFVTGKDEGSLRKKFEKNLSGFKFEFIKIELLWLERYAHYVHLLRYCDLGLCFHNSSSGLDLPMKVVDMFGVGIPAICVDFDKKAMQKVMDWYSDDCVTALSELVQHNKTGLIFRNAAELIDHILNCVTDTKQILAQLRSNVESKRNKSWDTDWDSIVKPLISSY